MVLLFNAVHAEKPLLTSTSRQKLDNLILRQPDA